MLSKIEVMEALRNTAYVPRMGKNVGRTIYEIAGPPGHFHIDYATFPGGTDGEVPFQVIDELARQGMIKRAFPDAPHLNAWKLADPASPPVAGTTQKE